MATKYYTFSGTVKWAKVYKPDTKYNPEGVYTLDLYPDENSKLLYNQSGIQVTPKEDEEGNRYVRLKRDHAKTIKGKLVDFGPPEIVFRDKEGNLGDLIGNGSEVKIEVAVYDTFKGKGHRVNRITVTKLVRYERPEESEVLKEPTEPIVVETKVKKLIPF